MAKIIIKSLDSFGEKSIQKMIAKKKIENDIVSFSFNNKYGQGTINLSNEFTEIFKFGESESHLIIKPNSETNFYYNTTYLKKIFTILCENYSYFENKLTTTYVIYDDDIEINRISIEIIEIH